MILDRIIASRKKDIEKLKALNTVQSFIKQIDNTTFKSASFKAALLRGRFSKDAGQNEGGRFTNNAGQDAPSINIIAEVKKASPSKGLICPDFDYVQIAKDYEVGGAAAISVLTEPNYFLGADVYLTQIKQTVKLPVLRKDFIVDEWQIYEAKVIGADAILLIAAVLTQKEIEYFLKVARSLGMDCLVETHNEEEVEKALAANAEIIGVNNRNLNTFEVSLEVSERLRMLVPRDKVFVSESGIHAKEDITRLKKLGTDAVLIGESIVKSADRVGKLREFMEV